MRIFKSFYYLLAEYFLILRLSIISLFRKNPPKSWNQGKKGNILLIHGLHSSWLSLEYVANIANQAGYKIHILPSIGNNTSPVMDQATIVSEYINTHKLTDLIIIAHSKGGIIAKYLLDNLQDKDKILKIIAIATPFHGTKIAIFNQSNISELNRNSEFITLLHENKDNNHKIVSIRARIDNHIIPASSAMLEGAENIVIDIFGHTRILKSGKLKEIITKELDK